MLYQLLSLSLNENLLSGAIRFAGLTLEILEVNLRV